jgi:hypothetical protein
LKNISGKMYALKSARSMLPRSRSAALARYCSSSGRVMQSVVTWPLQKSSPPILLDRSDMRVFTRAIAAEMPTDAHPHDAARQPAATVGCARRGGQPGRGEGSDHPRAADTPILRACGDLSAEQTSQILETLSSRHKAKLDADLAAQAQARNDSCRTDGDRIRYPITEFEVAMLPRANTSSRGGEPRSWSIPPRPGDHHRGFTPITRPARRQPG